MDRRTWPASLTRVPYWVYQDEANYREELRRIFEGPVWNYACLESDVASPGDYRTTWVGEMPVVVVRADDGEVYGFENRCSHRGALIVLDEGGSGAKDFQCIYHAWRYDQQGTLVGIAFEQGSHGRGGMPAGFCKADHSPRKLRTATIAGLVFVSLSDEVPPIEEYLGDDVLGRLERVMNRPIRVLGRYTQQLPNNWKLYMENTKDTYHASLLHTFFGTFRITRLTQGGGVMVSPEGGHHASYTIDLPEDRTSQAYRQQGIRTEVEGLRLADPSLLDPVKEFNDDIQLQILTVFPNLVVQQIHNCLAVRQILPRGTGAMDLHWTYFGYADDSPEMLRRRLKQFNLVGPAGYVSMEDGCVGGFVQRGIAAAGDELSVVEMGGEGAASDKTRATEASVRGFWKAYRRYMGL
ncbi:MAG TPA: aromatic ring-hydroxylating dioxygenase subunit alpha [Burkholderiales bacterium]|nr:aromatic ring-hydroxylating dioxygenase subunit alpha [Burkholderiales bacterium]